ncbi:hypothetical protein N7U49_47210 [Streptomyces sp. AD2-2]|nr:hypothetical protein N7U49_47210 [Streptomyces sp. AD2-2]
MRERKRMIRLLVTDVTLTKTDHITVGVVLRGVRSHQLTLPRPQTAWELQQTDPAVITALDQLLNEHTDAQSADILNERGLPSGMSRPLTRGMIVHLRNTYQLRSHRQRLLDARPADRLRTRPPPRRPLPDRQILAPGRHHHRRPGQRQGRIRLPAARPRPGPARHRPAPPKRAGSRTLRNDPMRCSVMTEVWRRGRGAGWAGR